MTSLSLATTAALAATGKRLYRSVTGSACWMTPTPERCPLSSGPNWKRWPNGSTATDGLAAASRAFGTTPNVRTVGTTNGVRILAAILIEAATTAVASDQWPESSNPRSNPCPN